MASERNNEFGEHLYALRIAQGWTFREAAKRIGIAHSRLTELESGIDSKTGKRFKPSYISVIRAAKAYDVPPDELLALAGHEPGAELAPEEWRLVSGFRRLDHDARSRLLAFLDELGPGNSSTG